MRPAKKNRTESLFSFNFPRIALNSAEFCGEKRCIEMSLFLYVNSTEIREIEGILQKKT